MSFTVYKSSAGSGKTYTLVKEYLRLALSSPKVDDYKHILAITFTNKAANEMKERVLSALVQIAEKEPNILPLVNTLVDETSLSVVEIEKKAEEILKHILHHYADFSISTIDKFVYKIIRIFAFDFKPSTFNTLVDVEVLIPLMLKLFSNSLDTSKSSNGKILFAISMICTSDPNEL